MFKIIHKHNLAKTVSYEYNKRLQGVPDYFLNLLYHQSILICLQHKTLNFQFRFSKATQEI
jgi:hypothetical protein